MAHAGNDPNTQPADEELHARVRELEAQLADARAAFSRLSADAGLETRAELMRGELKRLHEQLREALMIGDRARDLEAELVAEKRRYHLFRQRRIIQLALRLAAIGGPAYRAFQRTARAARRVLTRARERRARAHHRLTQDELCSALRRARPRSHPTSGPLVSIVVLTRDGRRHIERLLRGLRDRTAYRSFETIVVDNASSDATDEMLARAWGFPLRVIRNEHNATFSAGNNQGIAEARGEFVLLLNNDVEPATEEWLGALVATLEADRARSAAGALLVYPERPDLDDPAHPDLTVQHAGIGFFLERGAPRARNLGGGTDPRDERWLGSRPVPAVTAACMLVRKDRLDAVGGLTEGYVYGTEDVDLCLKLLATGGETWFCGDAVLFHHEFGTQASVAADETQENRRRNWDLFAERWGPPLARSVRLDALEGAGWWTGGADRTVAITVTKDDPSSGLGDWYTAHALGAAFEARGWNVRYAEGAAANWYRLPSDIDLMIVLHDSFDVRRAPSHAYTIAWVRNWTDRWVVRPWFERYDFVVASSDTSARIIREVTSHACAILPLAADTSHFGPRAPEPGLACDYAFTGSRWTEAGRGVIDHIDVRAGERFDLYGKGWENDARASDNWRGFIPYERMPALYASTRIVLDDGAQHTLPYGAVNSRVFEALASGALVLTNNEAGSHELFAGMLPVYTTPAELRAQLDRFLDDENLRRATAERLRAIVLDRHSFDRRAEQFVALARAEVAKPKIALKIAASNVHIARAWGDTHFARDFARALRDMDFRPRVDLRSDWDERGGDDADIVVQLRGLHRYRPKPGAFNVLWVISHPDEVGPDECEAFDAVFVASDPFAESLRAQVSKPVEVLHQATAIERFRPVPPDPALRARQLFVGNSRNQFRPVVRWALELGMPLALYGEMWEQFVPPGTVRADYFPNERLNELYCSADIVLCDHWEDMVRFGFVSNRIFDALACGAFVLSDRVPGIEEMFGGSVPTFETKEEFAELGERYLDDPDERRRLATIGMERVRKAHSFEARAEQFLAALRPLVEDRARTMEDLFTPKQ